MIAQATRDRADERTAEPSNRIPNLANVSSYHDDAEIRSPVVDRILARLQRRRKQSGSRSQ